MNESYNCAQFGGCGEYGDYGISFIGGAAAPSAPSTTSTMGITGLKFTAPTTTSSSSSSGTKTSLTSMAGIRAAWQRKLAKKRKKTAKTYKKLASRRRAGSKLKAKARYSTAKKRAMYRRKHGLASGPTKRKTGLLGGLKLALSGKRKKGISMIKMGGVSTPTTSTSTAAQTSYLDPSASSGYTYPSASYSTGYSTGGPTSYQASTPAQAEEVYEEDYEDEGGEEEEEGLSVLTLAGIGIGLLVLGGGGFLIYKNMKKEEK
jgi:hypothetical protein